MPKEGTMKETWGLWILSPHTQQQLYRFNSLGEPFSKIVSKFACKKNSISHVDVEREAVGVVKEVVAAHIEVDQEQGKDEENLKGDFAKICWWMKNHLVGNEDDGDGFSFRKPWLWQTLVDDWRHIHSAPGSSIEWYLHVSVATDLSESSSIFVTSTICIIFPGPGESICRFAGSTLRDQEQQRSGVPCGWASLHPQLLTDFHALRSPRLHSPPQNTLL